MKKNWLLIIPPFILATITAIFYYPSLNYAFQFDDLPNILKFYNIRFATFKNLIFSSSRWISRWLNTIYYKIDRFEPFVYRLGNLIIHITSGIILFYFIFSALNNLKKKNFFKNNAFSIAFLTSALFLLHPVQTQTISYVIQGQLEGLSGMFILGMLLCFLKLIQAKNKILKSILSLLLFVLTILSCGTKEISIVSPVLILLTDWFFIAQGDLKLIKKRFWIHLGIFSIIIGSYLYTLSPKFFIKTIGLQHSIKNNVGNVLTNLPEEKINPLQYLFSEFKVILHYIWIFIWPFNISVDYDWKLVPNFFHQDCILPLLTLLTIGLLIFQLLKRNKINIVSFGLIWFFICVLPRASIIPSAELLVDYKTYLGSVGIFLILASAFIKLFEICSQKNKICNTAFNNKPIKYLILLIILLLLGFSTYQRNKVWSSGLAFWGDMLKKGVNKPRVYNNYGVELSYKNNHKEAIPFFKKAIKMDYKYPDPCNNLAISYATTGKLDQAIQAYQKAININPNYPEVYNNLGRLFIEKKEYNKAEQALNIAIKLRPYYGKAFLQLGKMYFSTNKDELAYENFKKCCTQGDLDNDIGFQYYAAICMKLKKYDEAVFAYEKLISLNANLPDLIFCLANAHYLNNNHKEALNIYLKIASNNRDKRILFNLAETYMALHQPEKAIPYFEEIKNHVPVAKVRIAACLDQLGSKEKAKETLANIIEKEKNVAIKQQASTLLAQINNIVHTEKLAV